MNDETKITYSWVIIFSMMLIIGILFGIVVMSTVQNLSLEKQLNIGKDNLQNIQNELCDKGFKLEFCKLKMHLEINVCDEDGELNYKGYYGGMLLYKNVTCTGGTVAYPTVIVYEVDDE